MSTDPNDQPPTDAEILYGNPDAIASGYRPVFSDPLTRLQDAHGLKDAERETLLTDSAVAFADAKISSTAAAPLLTRMVLNSITPPDAPTLAQWETESRRTLREQYGEAEAEKRLATVRQFIAARPSLSRLIGTGAGSHPDVVAAFAAQAHALRVHPLTRKE